jgi:hypothetical protein
MSDQEYYQRGYTDGYDEALDALTEFVVTTDKQTWSVEILQEILHLLRHGTEEELIVFLHDMDPITLH